MEFVKVTAENLEREHICCAISDNDDKQVKSKKNWLSQRFDEGLVFLKGNIRGKCFIEYIPVENAWAPINADGYMYIDCLWVSGQFKGHGYSNVLLEECMKDSMEKGKAGIVCLSSSKKAGFLSDPKYLKHKGFEIADTSSPYFDLYYYPFDKNAKKPSFRNCVREHSGNGYEIYYTDQCPYTAKYVPLLKKTADEKKVPLSVVHLDTKEKAQNAPCPFTTFSLFYNGKLVTHEILSEKKFENIICGKSG